MSMTIAQAKSELMQIYGMLSPDKQRAIDTLVKIEPKTDVSEYDIDHIWYKGGQYISLRRFLKVKAEAEQEPCEDAISRKAVMDLLSEAGNFSLLAMIADLPSVNPQEPKTQESEKINCNTTKCENCINHNYCDAEADDFLAEVRASAESEE